MDDSQEKTCQLMISMAKEKLHAADELVKAGCYNDALSRCYYGAFHAVSMILYLKGQTYSRHGQVLGAFNRDFIASGLLPKELGKALGSLFDSRQSADYDVFQHATQDEAKLCLQEARSIVEAILEYARATFGFSYDPSQEK